MVQRVSSLRKNILFVLRPSWLGWVLIVGTAKGVCAIHLGDRDTECCSQIDKHWPHAKSGEEEPVFMDWVAQIMTCIDRPQENLIPPLELEGTVFQKKVWAILQTIPPGSTVSYAELARRMGNPKAVRAVAQACGANPVAVVVPCHRVIASDGSLRGYRWGSARKHALLDREGAQLKKMENRGFEPLASAVRSQRSTN